MLKKVGISVLVATAALVAAGGLAVAQDVAVEAARCEALRGLNIAASEIGEPTSGADVATAQFVEDEHSAGGAFCRITGSIDPVDDQAPDINFQVNLPLTWNSKALQFGGGAYNGTLIEATGNVSFGADDAATPLQRGYMTFGSDSGHQGSGLDGRFMLNDEALANFGGLQLKKTHDVALIIGSAYYGEGPGLTYFQGNSQGGHEALLAVQRWPDDYDGALITHPANPFSALQMSGNMAGKALYQPGAWVSPEEVELLNDAVITACDELDGIEDGLISNVVACGSAFDIATLRCADGQANGACFSDAQIAALNTINTRWEAPSELHGGADGFARWPIFEGADLYGLWGMGSRPEASVPPTPVADFGLAVLSDPLIRFAITRDPTFDWRTFDPNEWAERLREVSEIIDANQADLSPFADKGGKILLMHGTTDFAITPHNTTEYYARTVAEMGPEKVRDFVRYYLVPGFGHGSGRFIMRWDPLTALENWVEKGEPPVNLVTTDVAEQTMGRSRPMCEYPSYPHYDGQGDPNQATSFSCEVP